MGRLHCIHPLHPKVIGSDLDPGDRAVLNDLVTEGGQQSQREAVRRPGSPDIYLPNLGKVNPSRNLALTTSLFPTATIVTVGNNKPPSTVGSNCCSVHPQLQRCSLFTCT